MTVNLCFFGGAGAQFLDNNGKPLSGGKLYTYLAGTSTPQATYSDNAGSISHTNPIILDASGRVPGGEIWVDYQTSYKFILRTSNDALVGTWDNVKNAVVDYPTSFDKATFQNDDTSISSLGAKQGLSINSRADGATNGKGVIFDGSAEDKKIGEWDETGKFWFADSVNIGGTLALPTYRECAIPITLSANTKRTVQITTENSAAGHNIAGTIEFFAADQTNSKNLSEIYSFAGCVGTGVNASRVNRSRQGVFNAVLSNFQATATALTFDVVNNQNPASALKCVLILRLAVADGVRVTSVTVGNEGASLGTETAPLEGQGTLSHVFKPFGTNDSTRTLIVSVPGAEYGDLLIVSYGSLINHRFSVNAFVQSGTSDVWINVTNLTNYDQNVAETFRVKVLKV